MIQLTLMLKVTTAQVVKMSGTVNNSPIQDYAYLDQISPTCDVIQRLSFYMYILDICINKQW